MWAAWLISAIVLMIAEIFTPGFVLACFSIGCLVSCVTAFFTHSIPIQISAFIISSLLIFFFIRPLMRLFILGDGHDEKTNVDALIGKLGMVSEPIDPSRNTGRVLVGGEDWKGVTENREFLNEGTEIEVLKVDGTKLVVKPLYKNQE
jgi:membrane protein implicated in regulation of membrane protease activity